MFRRFLLWWAGSGATISTTKEPIFEPVPPIVEMEKPDESSFMLFKIADDLSVTMESNINSATLEEMIKAEYLNEVESEQEEVIHLAAVVLAGDIVTGVISDING